MHGSQKLLVWPAWLALLACLALLIWPRTSQAAEVRRGERIEVGADEVIDDALVALGERVVIAGQVRGDVVAFARTVRVEGTIDGNLITAAEQVELVGQVGGSVMAAGQELAIAGELGSQLYAAGQQVALGEELDLLGDALLAATDLEVAGTLGRDLYAAGEQVEVDAALARDLVLSGDELRVAGEVGRDLRAAVPDEEDFVAEHAMVAGVTEVEVGAIADDSPYDDFGYWFWQLAMLAAALIFGLLASAFAPGLFRAPREQDRWLRVVLIGLGGLIAIPVASLFTAATIVGLPLAAFAIGAYVLAIYLGKLVIATEIGRRVLRSDMRRRSQLAWSLLLGLVIVTVLVELPVVGGVFGFVFAVLGLGSVSTYLLDRRRRRHGG